MSTKTTFKRIALVAVAALGLGVLSVAPSQAAFISETLTIDASADTATVGDTATAVLTHSFAATTAQESSTITYACSAPAGASCPQLKFYQTKAQAQDTATIVAHAGAAAGAILESGSWTDSNTSAAGAITSTVNVKATDIPTPGTYTYTIYASKMGVVGPTLTWTVTAAADNTTATGIYSSWIATDVATASNGRTQFRASSDSAVTVDRGSTTAAPVAYAFVTVKNSAGETKTTAGNVVTDSITATIISGPGLLSNTAATPSTGTSSVVLNVQNKVTLTTTETLTILSNGIAGVTTIRLTNISGTQVGTFTVTFTGPVSTIPQIWLSDTVVTKSETGKTVSVIAKDSGGSVVTTGSLFLYAGETKVVNTAATYLTGVACTAPTSGSVWTCPITLADTGTTTLVVRDSSTTTLSTAKSDSVTITVTGEVVASLTATFDKATYLPGEKAVITLTAKDIAGRGIATSGNVTSQFTVLATPTLTYQTTDSLRGTQASLDSTKDDDFVGYLDTGIETRVVTMPTYGTAVSYQLSFATFGSTSGAKTTVTASATVADPTKDAADAATDAALEATDAAYAAQDAAQLAAEAADAATAAAEAATAAVEDLATQVASLFADLQKQITTLANVVAKIAKKVKA